MVRNYNHYNKVKYEDAIEDYRMIIEALLSI